MDKFRAMTFFCRVVQAGSFAAAAQSMEVVPSAMSKVVSSLERDLGFRLLNRSTRGFSLTEAGAAYHEQCRQILQAVEQAESGGGSHGIPARGTLRIGMHPGLRFEVLTRLGPFLQEQPGLTVETVVTNSPAAVVNDGLDLVLHIGKLRDSGLVARHVGWTRTVVCASREYLAAHGRPGHPREFSQHRAIIYARRDEESNTRWVFSRAGETVEVDVPVRVVLRDGVGVVDAAIGGCGIARPFEIAVRHWIRTGELVELLPDWVGEPQAISAVFASGGRAVPAKVHVYLEHVATLWATR